MAPAGVGSATEVERGDRSLVGSAGQASSARSTGPPDQEAGHVIRRRATSSASGQVRSVSRSRSRQRRPHEAESTSARLHAVDPSARVPAAASALNTEERPVRGRRAQVFEADLQPGHIHDSHVVYETQRYIFCAVCGTYGRYLKRTQLHAVCPRKPRNRWARMQADGLMQGQEPGGTTSSTPAVPYLAD